MTKAQVFDKIEQILKIKYTAKGGKMEEVAKRPSCYDLPAYYLTEQLVKDMGAWFLLAEFDLPPRTPLTTVLWTKYLGHAWQYSAQMHSIPYSKGLIWVLKDGKNYNTPIVPRPEEVPERERLFQERVAPLLDNYEEMYQKEKEETTELFRPFKEVDVNKLSDIELKTLFYQSLEVWRGQWERHMYWMFFGVTFFGLFEDICRELLGLDFNDPLFQKLVSGFMSATDRVNKEIWTLSGRARELGLADLFLTTEDAEEVLASLEGSEPGEKWLEEFREFIKAHGWRCVRMSECATPSWIDKPSLVIPDITREITIGEAFSREEKFARLVKEREESQREILAKVPGGQRDWFEKVMRVALFYTFWNEDHSYYWDMPAHSTLRKILNQIGERWAKEGVIDDPSDIYLLTDDEIILWMIPAKHVNLRTIVDRHRQEYESYLRMPPEFIIGDVNLIEEFVRRDRLVALMARRPRVVPELKADLYGACSSSGVAEGIARVVMSEDGIKDIQPGDILVAPSTTSTWTPVFSIIKAVVTDAGGELAHAAILSREYGLPAVVGTQEAARKIRTGDRIRVDGNLNAVFILERGSK